MQCGPARRVGGKESLGKEEQGEAKRRLSGAFCQGEQQVQRFQTRGGGWHKGTLSKMEEMAGSEANRQAGPNLAMALPPH